MVVLYVVGGYLCIVCGVDVIDIVCQQCNVMLVGGGVILLMVVMLLVLIQMVLCWMVMFCIDVFVDVVCYYVMGDFFVCVFEYGILCDEFLLLECIFNEMCVVIQCYDVIVYCLIECFQCVVCVINDWIFDWDIVIGEFWVNVSLYWLFGSDVLLSFGDDDGVGGGILCMFIFY